MPARHTFFATCPPGLEPFLHAEARALKLPHIERQTGGIRFGGTLVDGYRANLHLRTAIRVLLRLERFQATTPDELYAGARSIDWTRFLAPEGTLRVDAQSRDSRLDHTRFIEQRIKDAIVDSFRERTSSNTRPGVSLKDPDLRVHAHVFQDRVTLSADTSGDSLHKRGWRQYQGRAPLSETLAAAMVLASGWDRRSPLVDPFCGSATLLVEAALIAGNVAPGLFRPSFGFERWPGYDAALFNRMREDARAAVSHPRKLILQGSDADPERVDGALRNLAAADLAERIELTTDDALARPFRRGWNAWIVTNPPYGERVTSTDLNELYRAFGERLVAECAGYHLALLSGNPDLARELAVRPDERVALKNGAIDCELLLAELRS